MQPKNASKAIGVKLEVRLISSEFTYLQETCVPVQALKSFKRMKLC